MKKRNGLGLIGKMKGTEKVKGYETVRTGRVKRGTRKCKKSKNRFGSL